MVQRTVLKILRNPFGVSREYILNEKRQNEMMNQDWT